MLHWIFTSRLLLNTGITVLNVLGRLFERWMIDERSYRVGVKKLLSYHRAYGDDPAGFCLMARSSGWAWRQDPVYGLFDYTSDPAVTVMRKSGDCDDFAKLWSEIIPGVVRIATVKVGMLAERGHVIGVVETGENEYAVLSNLQYLPGFMADSPLKAAAAFVKHARQHGVSYLPDYYYVFNDKDRIVQIVSAKDV